MPDNPIKRLIGDIHRRSLCQVLGIYLLGSWLVYQVVQSLTEGLGLPDWFPAFAVVFLLLGLPMVLATAFVQEGRPAHEEDGVPADDVDRAPAAPTTLSLLFTWRNAFLGGVGAFAIVGMIAGISVVAAIWWFARASVAWPWFVPIGTAVTMAVGWALGRGSTAGPAEGPGSTLPESDRAHTSPSP